MKRLKFGFILFAVVGLLFAVLAGLSEANSDRPTHEKLLLNIGGTAMVSASVCHALDHLIYGSPDQHAANMFMVGATVMTVSICHNQYRDALGFHNYDTQDIFLGMIGTGAGLLIADHLFKTRIAPMYDPYGRRLGLRVNF